MGTKIVKSAYGKPIRGIGTVRLKGKNGLVIDLGDKGQYSLVNEKDAKTFELPKGFKGGTYSVSMASNGNRLFSLYPHKGTFLVKTRRFAAKEGGVPTPWIQHSQKWGTDSQRFTVLLEILEGEYKGWELPVFFDYKFGAQDGQMVVVGKGRGTETLVNYMNYAGYNFDSDEIVAADNVLPDLEDLLIRRKKPFYVVMENGFMQAVAPAHGVRAVGGRKKAKVKGRKIL